MKTKKILRFYFTADSLERAFDNLIIHKACDSGSDALATAERLCSVIGDKMQLERLWAYLDGVLSQFSKEERLMLSGYAARRAQKDIDARAVRCTLAKFIRRARRLSEFSDGISTLEKYGCLI